MTKAQLELFREWIQAEIAAWIADADTPFAINKRGDSYDRMIANTLYETLSDIVCEAGEENAK